MTLVQVKNHKVYDLPTLLRIALKSVFEPENMTTEQYDLMMSSIIDWKNHLNMKSEAGEGMMSAVDEENEYVLQRIGNLLKENEEGKLERRKEHYRIHKIDYKKAYRLPGSWVPQDFARAKELYESLPKGEQ